MLLYDALIEFFFPLYYVDNEGFLCVYFKNYFFLEPFEFGNLKSNHQIFTPFYRSHEFHVNDFSVLFSSNNRPHELRIL